MSDPLSEILALISAHCEIPRGFTAGGRWGVWFEPTNQLKITAVVRGSHWLKLEGEACPVELRAGDVAVFDGSRAMTYMSHSEVPVIDSAARFRTATSPLVQIGDGNDVVSIGGHIDLNEVGESLLRQALPPFLPIRPHAEHADALQWLLRQLVQEMLHRAPGAPYASDQLSQLIFIHVMRAALENGTALPVGWLRALGDPRLTPALHLMHSEPARDWGLAELASACAMSRTTFAERFRSIAGVPPLAYLKNWRMLIARRSLQSQDVSISELARSLGFGSDSAFSNAFKRSTGLAPSQFRATRRVAIAAD